MKSMRRYRIWGVSLPLPPPNLNSAVRVLLSAANVFQKNGRSDYPQSIDELIKHEFLLIFLYFFTPTLARKIAIKKK